MLKSNEGLFFNHEWEYGGKRFKANFEIEVEEINEKEVEEINEKKEEAMREEAREAILEALRNGYTGYYCDLHHEVFNTSYYISSAEQAKEALKEYDVFAAIEKVKTYEEDNFGEIYTDLSDPVKLVNMLYYIIGEEVLFEMMDGIRAWNINYNYKADEETNAEILRAIEEKEKQIQQG